MTALELGDMVHVRDDIGRRSRIVDITTNELGTVCYWLADGGMFSSRELELDEQWKRLRSTIQ